MSGFSQSSPAHECLWPDGDDRSRRLRRVGGAGRSGGRNPGLTLMSAPWGRSSGRRIGGRAHTPIGSSRSAASPPAPVEAYLSLPNGVMLIGRAGAPALCLAALGLRLRSGRTQDWARTSGERHKDPPRSTSDKQRSSSDCQRLRERLDPARAIPCSPVP